MITEQPTLFGDGQTLKTEGIRNALAAVPATWTTRAHVAIEWLSLQTAPFTSEDVIDLVGLPNPNPDGPNRNNAVGAIMNAAARQGLIRKIGYVESRRPTSHAAMLAQWTGTDLA